MLVLQLQYALAHAVLEPRPICQALHLCDRSLSLDANLKDVPTTLQSIHKAFKQLISEKLPNETKAIKLSLSGQREEVYTTLQRQRIQSKQRIHSAYTDISRDTKLQRDDLDTITILQLADIHIDPLYSEVGGVFLYTAINK